MHADILQRAFLFLTILEALELDDERTLVRTLTCDEVIAGDTHTAGDGGVGGKHAVHFVHYLIGLLHRSSRRCRYCTEYGTRILVRHKTGLCGAHKHAHTNDGDDYCNDGDDGALHDATHTLGILLLNLAVSGVERCVEAVNHGHLALLALLVLRLQQDGA